jgi:hypothetical protein
VLLTSLSLLRCLSVCLSVCLSATDLAQNAFGVRYAGILPRNDPPNVNGYFSASQDHIPETRLDLGSDVIALRLYTLDNAQVPYSCSGNFVISVTGTLFDTLTP